jgi:hypothetical protein
MPGRRLRSKWVLRWECQAHSQFTHSHHTYATTSMQVQIEAPVTLAGPSGRIWPTDGRQWPTDVVTVLAVSGLNFDRRIDQAPKRLWGARGLASGGYPGPKLTWMFCWCAQVPSSKVSEDVRTKGFSVAALDARGDSLLCCDLTGATYLLRLTANRYVRLNGPSNAGTAAVLAGPRAAFVGHEDGSIRAFDPARGTQVGLLHGHRTTVTHLEVRRSELLSCSQDAVALWDTRTLRRKRALGGGPYGALQASWTSDGTGVVVLFRDGSLHSWACADNAGGPAPLWSMTLPTAAALRPQQCAFALSPDGEW